MAISEKDLPANWGVKGGPYDEVDEKIAWFKSHDVTIEDLISAGAITADEAPWFKTQGLKSVGDRVDTLAAEFDHIPKFKIAADINAGLSDEAIRAKYTVTPDVAAKLMQQSMTTGTIDPYAFARLGGYDAVKEVYDANQGSYNLADIPLSQLKSAADRIATTGVGNKAVLDLVKSNTQQQQQQQQQQPFKSVTGDTGVKVEGESGLREGYTDYVQDMLQRAAGLLARRNVNPVTGEPTYTGPQFGGTGAGGYGTETAQTLKDLQARREAMMGMGEDKSAMFQPYQYSFAPKPAKSGGVMSLVDHYDDGGAVGNAAVTTSGGVGSDTIAGGTQGAQVVPSTYSAPTNTYTGPGATGITTGSFDPAAISRFTNQYTTAVTDPQVREAKRQAELAKLSQAAKFTQAGAFGGSGRILAENEIGRNLATQVGDIYGKGQKEAFDAALRAFEAEEGRKLTAGIETERARQEAGRQGLTGAANEAQYQQLARDLQQRAEEATARGDQFAANLALQQLAEANRAAEATRQFEYTQARDTYLDPFRELGYASQLLTGLPIKAGDTGTSSLAEAIAGGAGGVSLVNSIINNPTYMADLRKALGLPPG